MDSSKTRYTFFHKPQIADDIPLQLPPLWINNILIKREYSIKFLGVILDENLSWKSHIKLLENKIAKNVGILYKSKFILNQKRLKSIYYAFIHSYISDDNIAWGSTHQTKLRKFHLKQKHAVRIDKHTLGHYSRNLMR